MTEERVEFHLWNWARWHYFSREAGIGYPSIASGGATCYTSTGDDDREWDKVCRIQAAATEVVIDGLPAIYRLAVYAHDLGGPWPHEVIALGIHYRAAIPMIGRGLDRRGVL